MLTAKQNQYIFINDHTSTMSMANRCILGNYKTYQNYLKEQMFNGAVMAK